MICSICGFGLLFFLGMGGGGAGEEAGEGVLTEARGEGDIVFTKTSIHSKMGVGTGG